MNFWSSEDAGNSKYEVIILGLVTIIEIKPFKRLCILLRISENSNVDSFQA